MCMKCALQKAKLILKISCLEILALDDNSELVENPRSYGLLMESPEPVDWIRVSLTVSFSADCFGQQAIQEATEMIKILGANISNSGNVTNEFNNEWIDLILRD